MDFSTISDVLVANKALECCECGVEIPPGEWHYIANAWEPDDTSEDGRRITAIREYCQSCGESELSMKARMEIARMANRGSAK